MIVAEGVPHGGRIEHSHPLQWGRNLIVAEGVHIVPFVARLVRFNGAAT